MTARIAMIIASFALLAGSSGMAQDLETYRQKYDDALKQITADHQQRTEDITEVYSAGLNALKARVQAAGELNKLKAVMEEISRFQMNKTFPTEEETPILDISAIVRDCQVKIKQADAAKAQRIVSLASQYDNALLHLQKEHTRKGELDKATAIQEERIALGKTETLTVARNLLDKSTNVPPNRSTPESRDPRNASKELVLTIRTYIDGKDTLSLKANQAWFTHHYAALPGRHGSNNYPTYVGKSEWIPKWNGNTSEPYMGIRPPLPRQPAKRVAIELVKARGRVNITEKPSRENNYTVSIHFDDPAGGADWYEVVIRLEY